MSALQKQTIHAFEDTGLGKAPFNFVKITVGRCRCQYCGTHIKYQFHIKSSDNKEFIVGSDCVDKTGDYGLMNKVGAATKLIQRQKRQAQKETRLNKKKSKDAEIILGGKLPFGKYFQQSISDIAQKDPKYLMWLVSTMNTDTSSLGDAVRKMVAPAIEPALNAAKVKQEAIEKQKEDMKTSSKHIGIPGIKVALHVQLIKKFQIQNSRFASDLMTFVDKDNNVFTVFYTGSQTFVRGEFYNIKATIKAHVDYQGTKQTQLTRIKIA